MVIQISGNLAIFMPFPINDDAKIAFFSENNYFQGIIFIFFRRQESCGIAIGKKNYDIVLPANESVIHAKSPERDGIAKPHLNVILHHIALLDLGNLFLSLLFSTDFKGLVIYQEI